MFDESGSITDFIDGKQDSKDIRYSTDCLNKQIEYLSEELDEEETNILQKMKDSLHEMRQLNKEIFENCIVNIPSDYFLNKDKLFYQDLIDPSTVERNFDKINWDYKKIDIIIPDDASPEFMLKLSKHKDINMRAIISKNKNISKEMCHYLVVTDMINRYGKIYDNITRDDENGALKMLRCYVEIKKLKTLNLQPDFTIRQESIDIDNIYDQYLDY